VFGSLEYKKLNVFYIAVFNGEKITSTDMPHHKGGVMKTVCLGEVSKDYTDTVTRQGKKQRHRYGCSGIDGVAVGTVPGSADDKLKLMVAYGIYPDTGRDDNDHQVILQYDLSAFDAKAGEVFDPESPHFKGPNHEAKYFVYTGNTTYGVQNLEYDKDTHNYWMAVYTGKKSKFPNYPLYLIDGKTAPVKGLVRGQDPKETGLLLALAKQGTRHESSGVYGFPRVEGNPATGMICLGRNLFYIAKSGVAKKGELRMQYGDARLFRLNRKTNIFSRIKANGQ